MLIVDGQGRLRALSESLARLVGLPVDELTGRPVWALLPGWSPAQPAGKSYNLTLPALHASILVQVSCESLRLHGETLFFCDITTPSRRADWRAGEAILVSACDGEIVHVNRSFEVLTGHGAAEALGRTPSILKSGMHGAEVYRELWTTLLAGEVYRGVLVNRRKDGALYREEKIIRPVRDRNGWPILFFASGWAANAQCRRSAARAACTAR